MKIGVKTGISLEGKRIIVKKEGSNLYAAPTLKTESTNLRRLEKKNATRSDGGGMCIDGGGIGSYRWPMPRLAAMATGEVAAIRHPGCNAALGRFPAASSAARSSKTVALQKPHGEQGVGPPEPVTVIDRGVVCAETFVHKPRSIVRLQQCA